MDSAQVRLPGRWLGGLCLVLGPLAMLTGALLRIPYHFFFPQQLQAYSEEPLLLRAAYSFFVAGNVLLWPAVLSLSNRISERRPGWGMWGGALALFGLFARTFHAGVDHLALQLVNKLGVERATEAVASTYGAFHIFQVVSFATLTGWIVLAMGAYLSGALGPARSLLLALMAGLMSGVLKGTSAMSIVWIAGLCAALVPLGVQVLRGQARV